MQVHHDLHLNASGIDVAGRGDAHGKLHADLDHQTDVLMEPVENELFDVAGRFPPPGRRFIRSEP